MNVPLHLWLIPLLPLAGFLLNGILGSRLPKWLVTTIALLAPLGAFGAVVYAYLSLNSIAPPPCVTTPCGPPGWVYTSLPHVETFGTWISLSSLHIDFSFALDQLTLVMLLVVTGVGFLIHIYSVGYMHGDPGYARYFSYLNLFLFFMTTLVLAGNVLVMFVGWEGVGLASYLLIGFWFNKTSAASAGMKAFVVNRIGDFGFLIGIFFLLANFGTLTFSEIATKLAASPAWTGGVLTTICLCLLVGATGKSAQLPLYVWLPDAMEGPTPVSALIHAATMVTAGVYMIARFHFLFDRSPFALSIVAIIGAATALFAATMGLAQNDIKRVLAYSTISQLGYMFLGCGVAAYSAAIFHLMTHAFFKALLFLGAGSAIHALGGEQDLRKMGGLRKKIPITFWTMTAAVLAISGFPGLSGFFSKDAILAAAFQQGTLGKALWAVGVFTAGLTALYMFRLWYLAFIGDSRDEHAHPHEGPWSILGPLVLLAILSIGGGWVSFGGRFYDFPAPVTGPRAESGPGSLEYILMGIAVGVGLLGWLIAHFNYKPGSARVSAAALAAEPTGFTKLLAHKYYVDEIYHAVFVRPLLITSRYILWWAVDSALLGGAAWLLGGIATLGGAILQRWQSGNLRSYAAWLAAGAATVLLFAFYASIGTYLGAHGIDVHWMGR
jgi:NADH-quinone oxidoreductase subunit L